MKKALGFLGRGLLAVIMWLTVAGALGMAGLFATGVALLIAVAVDGLALRLASLDTMCGLYTGAEFAECSAFPWFRIATLVGLFGLGAGLYYGYHIVKELIFPGPAETEPGEGDGRPHREADDSEDPRWRMLRMAAHIAWLRHKFPEASAEHTAFLSRGDNEIVADYILTQKPTWDTWADWGKPPSCYAPPHPGQGEP